MSGHPKSLIKCCGQRIKKTGHHVNTKPILCSAGKPGNLTNLNSAKKNLYLPAHIYPVGLTDQEICSIHFVSSLALYQVAGCIPPDDTFLALISLKLSFEARTSWYLHYLNVAYKPSCFPRLDHDRTDPTSDGGPVTLLVSRKAP